MLRLILVAVTLGLVIGSSIPASAQPYKHSCEDRCLKRCAIKELAPGLYRGECQTKCTQNCYRTRAEKSKAN
jgi:uncharacterized protein with FMN-binding domain